MARTGGGSLRDARAGHELVDHTSEITLRLWAADFPGLLAEATRAFGELVPSEMVVRSTPEHRGFRVSGVDRAAALVEWLNEMVYLSEAQEWLPMEVEEVAEHGRTFVVEAVGLPLTRPFVLVKAATLHRAHITGEPGELSMEVTLDV